MRRKQNPYTLLYHKERSGNFAASSITDFSCKSAPNQDGLVLRQRPEELQHRIRQLPRPGDCVRNNLFSTKKTWRNFRNPWFKSELWRDIFTHCRRTSLTWLWQRTPPMVPSRPSKLTSSFSPPVPQYWGNLSWHPLHLRTKRILINIVGLSFLIEMLSLFRTLLKKQASLNAHSQVMPVMLYLRGISARGLNHVLEFVYSVRADNPWLQMSKYLLEKVSLFCLWIWYLSFVVFFRAASAWHKTTSMTF